MGDAGSHRAALQTVVAQKAKPHMAGAVMPLEHCQLDDLLRHVHAGRCARVLTERNDLFGGQQSVRGQADHPLPGAGLLQLQLLRGDLVHVEGIEHPRKPCFVHGKGGGVQHFALLRHQFALFVHLLHRELFQIGQHDQVGGIAGSYRAAVRKTEVLAGNKGAHAHRHHRVYPGGNGLADDVVDVPALQQVSGVLVIRHQHTAATIRFPEQGQKIFHVLGCRALPHHDVLSAPQLFHGFMDVRAFMVGLHPGGDIGVQLLPAEEGRMSVNFFARSGAVADLLQDLFVRAHRAVGVHQLCQTQHPGLLVIGAQLLRFQHRAGLVQPGGGHTGGQHEVDRKRQIFRGLQHKIQPCRTCYIGDLVRVGDHRRSAVGQNRLFKGRTAEHGAFNVDVPIHKPRADILALQVQLGLAGIVPHAKDDALTDGYIGMLDLVCEHIDDPGVFQHQLCPHVTLCCQDLLLQGFHFHKNPLVPLKRLRSAA